MIGVELADVGRLDEDAEDATTAGEAFELSEFVVCECGEGDSRGALSGLLRVAVRVLGDLVQLGTTTGEVCSLVEGVVFAVGSFGGVLVTDFVCV